MTGGNGYAVQDAWIKHQQESRRQAADRKLAAQRDRERERQEIADKIRERMTDMVDDQGRVDGFAIYAALMLKHEGKDPTPTLIRERCATHKLPSGRTVAQAEKEGWE